MTEHESTTTVLRKNKKVLIASLTGSAIEWFDYFLYGTAAALVFNKIFFPMVDPVIGLILSYLSFSLTFFIRPIGGSALRFDRLQPTVCRCRIGCRTAARISA